MIRSRNADYVADRSAATLTVADLEALARGDVLACRLTGFYDRGACVAVQRRVIDANRTHYEVAPNVEKIGMALFEATDGALLDAYYADAQIAEARMKAIYQGMEDPIARLRQLLDALWPGGCEIEQLHDQPMYAGLIRVIDAASELRPHQDNTHWDMPASTRAQTMRAQFSANVYFSVAEEGGELELWPFAIHDEARYRELQVPDDYALSRSAIGEPALVVRPEVGDLIIFDARRIHAVAKVKRGSRSNASTFIGLRDQAVPLTLFS